jgi:hypothetical protein
MQSRGLLTGEPALRMCRFLADTDTVAADGAITDVPAMISAYAARCRVSRQTAYTDLRRVIACGLVRQVQAAAPGYRAMYRLSYPAAMVDAEMPGLPDGLARALPHRHKTADDERAADRQPGSADNRPGDACAGLDPSPLTREGKTPCPGRPGKPRAHHRQGAQGKEPSSEETAQAAEVLRACRPRWLAQRGWQGMPDPSELRPIEHLTAVALRYAGPSELVLVLTQMVASASDLPRVLAWRLTRIVTAAEHVRSIAVDEEGRRWTAMASRMGNSAPTPGSSAAAELDRARAEIRAVAERSRLASPDSGGTARPRGHAAIIAEQLAEAGARRDHPGPPASAANARLAS